MQYIQRVERIITVRSTRLDNAEKKLEALGREKEAELRGKGVIKGYDSLFSRILIAPSLTDRKLGYFSPADKLIVISEEMLNSASWHDTENIFIHELGHALAFRLYKDLDHSASFRECCSMLGLEKGFEKSKVKLAAKETEKEKDRIRKLLALSSSPFENEAAEAIKKAKSLMARGSISLDEDREERIYMVPLYQAGRFPYYARVLMNYISESTGVYIVTSYNQDGTKTSVAYGTLEETETSIYLWDYLVSSAEREIEKLRKMGKHITKDSFIRGAVLALSSRTADADDDTALALIRNENKEKTQRMIFADMKITTRSYYSRGGDAASFRQGEGFGSKLSIPEKIGRRRIE